MEGIGLADLASGGDVDWDKVRADGIARMAAEDGVLWVDGHKIMTCGAHTGHTVRAIAYCEDAAWANAIVSTINAQGMSTRQGEDAASG
jgi:hypothetical protein